MLKSAWRWYALAIAVIALDQISKHWVSAALTYGEPVVFTPFFNFTLLHNPGAAFSFLSDAGGWQRWFFTVVAAVVSVVLVIWLARVSEKRYEALALALILGGAIGNLYDRVVLGYVVDFVVVHYQDYYWPAFNIADSAITVGAALLILDMLFGKDKRHD
ncbi:MULTISPECIES: signal peptidase II [unclassified Marinimicrobium]|jgi:signal peptidase II|uniref:signal peptidase II n=1 Tax=unclassified Marinimicrobium TaxID=2632100 RepID=UPI000C4735BD|nr:MULTISPECIES: signal peptidase II [unclassified Marinimicrobium]MAN52700.1 signal peptidase II [Marinimicrobium sp.]|tara:strand:+ start:1293 stop:1772 length:480 start_codon:yes stop_codon:yes gene_type:complete